MQYRLFSAFRRLNLEEDKEGWLVLLLIISMGLFFRIWGITWGFPRTDFNPDELNVFNISQRLSLRDLNPHFFSYSGFTFYLNYLTTHILVHFIPMEKWTSILIQRLWSVCWGVLTIIIVYKGAKELFQDKKTAYMASALMAITPLHIWDSHFGTTDISLTFWMTFAFFLGLRAYFKPTLKNFLMGGIIIGIAVGVKFNGILASITILAAFVLATFEGRIYPGYRIITCLLLLSIGI